MSTISKITGWALALFTSPDTTTGSVIQVGTRVRVKGYGLGTVIGGSVVVKYDKLPYQNIHNGSHARSESLAALEIVLK